jgi:hypothetical protein
VLFGATPNGLAFFKYTHTHTQTHTHTHTHTHSLTHSLTHTHTHSLTHSHTHAQMSEESAGQRRWIHGQPRLPEQAGSNTIATWALQTTTAPPFQAQSNRLWRTAGARKTARTAIDDPHEAMAPQPVPSTNQTIKQATETQGHSSKEN